MVKQWELFCAINLENNKKKIASFNLTLNGLTGEGLPPPVVCPSEKSLVCEKKNLK